MQHFARVHPLPAAVAQQDLVFQAVAWHASDCEYGEDDKYLVKVFGVTEEGYTVSVNLLDFPPYFFIKVPHAITDNFMVRLREHVDMNMPYQLKDSLQTIKVAQLKDFWGFQNEKKWSFVRLAFTNLKGMRAASRIFGREVFGRRYKLYESNIEPYLRLMHIRDIRPTGWMKVPVGYYQINESLPNTTCQIDVNCAWNCIRPMNHVEKNAPIMVVSFDLECTSSHGDFPVAKKEYRKTANELFQHHKDHIDTVTANNIVQEVLCTFDPGAKGALSKVFTKNKNDNLAALSNKLKPHGDAFLGILAGKLGCEPETFRCISLEKPSKKEDIIKYLTDKLGSLLPPLQGDPIIQIGLTAHCYGDRECTYRHIITLNSCAPIDGADITQCRDESELLLAFRDVLVKLDPDVITGYNILGFDMAYLVDRAEELNVKEALLMIGRFKEHCSTFQVKTLSSSALGDNILKFIDMEGRVIIDVMKVVQRDHRLDSYKLDNVANHFLKMSKHDVSPNDIFRMYLGSAEDRKVIAEYCLQDCALCNKLIMKLEILANNIGMSNVCSVPLSYIFMRGQGIKIFSLVAKQCREDKVCIPTLYHRQNNNAPGEAEEEDGYEGAIVLEPKVGMYLQDPISVLDYASLYPSSMISENLSHDMIVLEPKYDNLAGVDYLDITYDVYEGIGDKKVKTGEKSCRYVQPKNGEKGIIPRILLKLLKARKDTRKKIEYETLVLDDNTLVSGLVSAAGDNREAYHIRRIDGSDDTIDASRVTKRHPTYDEFQRAVLDGLQNAYKVTANSLYGQCGAKTSPIYMKEIAASTTAVGRKMITTARDYILSNYEGAEIIYGDTDSIFIKFAVDKDQEKKQVIKQAWDLGCDASRNFKKLIKHPHDLEMEKVMFPFILFSKKRYCAYKYEGPDAKPKLNSMGIVLKRRDNANIVKIIYGGIIDIIMNEQDIKKSIEFLLTNLRELIDGKYPIQDLIITKSLKGEYKDPDKIAHKVLAERMGERDPGNKPQVNDRIPYVYVRQPTNKKVLQGERIEHPDYIRQNKIQPDYEFYLTNQISTPVCQLYSLALEHIDGYRKPENYWPDMERKLFKEKEGDVKKAKERLMDLKEREAFNLLIEPIMNRLKNIKEGNQEITRWFKPAPREPTI
jgi:DNA polymerase elongation subunit (family B)